jgi:hypothetical protein
MNINKKISTKLSALFTLLMYTSFTIAQVTTGTGTLTNASGGLGNARKQVDSIAVGMYGVLGGIALIYLIYISVQCFAEKKEWTSLGWAILQVAVVGAVIAIGNWAWKAFGHSDVQTSIMSITSFV